MMLGSTPPEPYPAILHRYLMPSSSAFSLLITITAAPLSLMPDAFAAVTLPPSFLKAGLSLEIPSAVTPCLGNSSVSKIFGSPFFWGISTGTISSLNLPDAIAAHAFCWEAAANSSMSSLVTPN